MYLIVGAIINAIIGHVAFNFAWNGTVKHRNVDE
jgi:hypothetical protein